MKLSAILDENGSGDCRTAETRVI